MNKMTLAMYIRLSDEDADLAKNDLKLESNSVSNQRNLLMNFISNHPEISDCNVLEFCDDGYSGTNFERPAIKQLLTKVRSREIDGIIVKDFSRFGRNYLELGDYLEQVFPFLGVRFISVNDGYDSATDHGITAGIDVGFKNLIYDLYSKDLSQKVKTGKIVKMKKGEFIGSFAPYGFNKSKNNKNALVVDEEAALVVKRIFQMAADGDNTNAIAKILNAEGIPSPAVHFQKHHNNKKWSKAKGVLVWQTMAVLKIIHKRETPDVNSRRTVAVPREQWIVVPNTHEAIISEDMFVKAQNAIRKISKRKDYKVDNTRILYGQMKCGICKKNLQRFRKKVPYYKCNSHYYDENSLCYQGRIDEPVILEALLEAIRQQAQIANKAENIVSKTKSKSEKETASIFDSIRTDQQSLERLNALKIEEYEKYLDGKISKEVYLKQREKLNQEIEKTALKISKLESEYELHKLKSTGSSNKFVEHFKSKYEIKELSRELVCELVDSIYVFDENRIEIVWKFADDFEKVRQFRASNDM